MVPTKISVRTGGLTGKAAVGLIVLLMICGNAPAGAQDMPRLQVFGGYSFTRLDSKSFGFANQTNLNGYNFSPAYNLL